MQGCIAIDDPRAPEVRALLEQHLAFARETTRPEDIHALDVEALVDPAITFYSYRRNGQVVGVGALKRLDTEHAELKSMHTAAEARRQGIGRAMVEYLVILAREQGLRRLSLETGAQEAFEPARALYATAGFKPCGPFGDYGPSPNSAFMTLSF